MSQPVDRRRRQWVPLSVHFGVSKTGVALQREFGAVGLAVWALYLAACKRNWHQGQFTYAGEADGWERLGLLERPDFTLETFFDATGRLKQTSRRASGHLTDVLCTHWAEWNEEIRREREAEKKARIRATNTGDIERRSEGQTEPVRHTEVEVESYSEVEAMRPPPENGGRPRPDKPARTEAALSFVRNVGTAELGDTLDRYLVEEFNLAGDELGAVLEAAARAQASAEYDATLEGSVGPAPSDPTDPDDDEEEFPF